MATKYILVFPLSNRERRKNQVNKNSETVNRLCSVRIGNVLHNRGTYIGKEETRRKEARSGEREGGNHH